MGTRCARGACHKALIQKLKVNLEQCFDMLVFDPRSASLVNGTVRWLEVHLERFWDCRPGVSKTDAGQKGQESPYCEHGSQSCDPSARGVRRSSCLLVFFIFLASFKTSYWSNDGWASLKPTLRLVGRLNKNRACVDGRAGRGAWGLRVKGSKIAMGKEVSSNSC